MWESEAEGLEVRVSSTQHERLSLDLVCGRNVSHFARICIAKQMYNTNEAEGNSRARGSERRSDRVWSERERANSRSKHSARQ